MSLIDFVQRGQDLVHRSQYQDAVKVCRLGLLANPTSVDGRLVLATALMALRRYDEVLAEMRVALEVNGSNPHALTLRGEALLRKGDAAQAMDVLKRAASMDPSSSHVQNLLQEAEAHRVAVARQAEFPSVNYGVPADSATKHYPAHSGLDAGVDGSPAAVTRPTNALPDMGPLGDTPPPEVLAIGDRSGTIELDPDLDGIEVPNNLVDPPIEPPIAGELSGSAVMELRSDDLMEASQPFPSQASDDAPTAAFVPDDSHEAPTRAYAPPGSSDEAETGAYLPPEADHQASPAAYRRGALGAPSPFVPEFDEDGSTAARGKGRSDYQTGAETRPESPRARPGGPYQDHEGVAAGGGRTFPGDETGVSKMEALLGSPATAGPVPHDPDDEFAPTLSTRRAASEDMRTIRAGLGMNEESDPVRRALRRDRPRHEPSRRRVRDPHQDSGGSPVQPTPRGTIRDVRPSTFGVRGRRTKLLYLYGAIAVVVVASAVYGGLRLRDLRLDRQIRTEKSKADEYAERDTYAGYVKARDAYARIVKVRKKRKHQAALAKMQAAIAAEFGDGLEEAERLVGKLGTYESVDAALARSYLALARSDVEVASRLAEEVQKRYPGDASAPYIKGRALLLAERPNQAAEAFRAALRLTQRPVVYVGLGRAEAKRKRYAEALAAFERASDMVPGHPGAAIARARVMAEGRKLPGNLGDPETGLEQLIAASAAVEGSVPLVSSQQAAWAALALGEVKLARGDLGAARSAMARAHQRRPVSNWGFTKALVNGLLRVGETKAAEAEAERAVTRWPTYAEARILHADVLLLRENPERALASLAKLGNLSRHPTALTARGRAQLAKGDLDAAAKDLDAALALIPELRAAKVARAKLHLQTGNAKAAAEQLRAIYDQDANPEMGVTYASALRQTRQRAEARRILEGLLRGSSAADAYLEIARLERDEGRAREARLAYGKAIELAPNAMVARREAAMLALDTGDRTGAREGFDALLKDAPDDGRVLVEAARVHSLTGDYEEAGRLLDRAEKTSSAPRWQIARERGRVLARAQNMKGAKDALSELERAVSLKPDNGEARLLLIDVHIGLENLDGAGKVLKAVLKKFPNQPEKQLALGRFNLFEQRYGEAMTAFVKAGKLLSKDKAPARYLADVDYWIGQTHYYSDHLSSAAKAFQRAIKQDPGHADAYFFYGLVQFDMSRFKTARSAFKRATELDPDGPADAWFYLGEAAFEARKYGDARRALEAYLARSPKGEMAKDARKRLRELN